MEHKLLDDDDGEFEDFNPDHMTPDEIRKLLEPSSDKVKRNIIYDERLKRFQLSKEDEEIFDECGISTGKVYFYTGQIVAQRKLRPFEYQMPIYLRAVYWLAHCLAMLIYAYSSFIALQITLFNLILLGLIVIGGGKVSKWLSQWRFNQEYKYRHSHLEKFLAKANEEYFTELKVKVAAGVEGRWLEFQLPDPEDRDGFMPYRRDSEVSVPSVGPTGIRMVPSAIIEQSDEDDEGSQAPSRQ